MLSQVAGADAFEEGLLLESTAAVLPFETDHLLPVARDLGLADVDESVLATLEVLGAVHGLFEVFQEGNGAQWG